MTGNGRPRGRRLLLGGLALALLATAPGAAAAATDPAGEFTLEPVEVGVGTSALAAGPDGRVWAFSQRREDAELLRITGAGVESRQTVPTTSRDQGLMPLTDGRTAYVGSYSAAGSGLAYEEFSATADGPVTRSQLPGPGPIALAPDGARWQLLRCHVLQRTDTRGQVRRLQLSRQGCRLRDGDPQYAFGGDGTTWVVDLCAGWIARIAVDGSQRTWRMGEQEPACGLDDFSNPYGHLAMVTRDDGGLSFGLASYVGGRIGPRGKLVSASPDLLEVATPDGSTWYQTGTTLWRRGADGRRTDVVDPSADDRPVHDAAIGPDGRLWFNRYERTGWKAETRLNDLSYGVVDADGTAHSLDGLLGRIQETWDYPELIAGPDRAVWIADSAAPAAGAPQLGSTRLLRIVPRTPAAPGGNARPLRVVARSGSTLWLQVRCDAAPGSFCATSATLRARGGSGSLATAATAAVPGGASRTVALKLSASARQRLRTGRAVRADAVVTADGQEPARLAVTLRR